MDTKKKYGMMALLGVLVVGVVLISVCGESIDKVKDVRAEVDSNGNVIVHWHSVPIERDLIAYHVYWSRDSEFPQDNRNRVSTSSTTLSYAIEGLEPGKWYIRVRALFLRTYKSFTDTQQKEVEGTWSETVTVTIPLNKEETSTANLLTYNDETNGFTQHKDMKNQYSILYPSSWEPIPSDFVDVIRKQLPESRQLLLALWSKDGKLNMQVSKEKIEEDGSLNELYERSLANSPFPHTTVSKDEVTINGVPAIKAVNTTKTPAGKPAKYLHLFMIYDGHTWTVGIGGHPGSFDAQRADIDKTALSLSFERL